MATRPQPSKLTKSRPTAQKPREEKENYDPAASMGENAAPDNETHLMPGSAGGFEQSVGEPENDPGPQDDLSPDEMQIAGYPDPEITPEDSLISKREEGPMIAQVSNRVETAHKMLDEKLDSISTRHEQAQRVQAEEDEVDFANLPNVPPGDNTILGPDEPLRVEGEQEGGVVVLSKAVYRAVRPFRTKRWSFQLVHPKGAKIPMSAIRQVPQPQPKPEEHGTEETKETKTPAGTEPPHNAGSQSTGSSETK